MKRWRTPLIVFIGSEQERKNFSNFEPPIFLPYFERPRTVSLTLATYFVLLQQVTKTLMTIGEA
jgi:hypothetical protein